MEVTD